MSHFLLTWLKRLIILTVVAVFLAVAGLGALIFSISADLPQIITVNDYQPRLVSEVYARGGERIGEFFREKRVLVPYDQIPKHVVQAFLASEDDQFFEHRGINPLAIFRAALANLRAGKSAQGGSTITQQVAKTLLLTPEKTITRKLKDILLAIRMEQNLKKEEILYLYLNQIYFGQGAHGVATAAEVYFRKPVQKLSVAEAALLAGLPQAPTRYSPVNNPKSAKERQLYVLRRMAEVGYISREESEASGQQPLTVNTRVDYAEVAPFYIETLRQLLVQRLGEATLLDKGLKIQTGLDYQKQLAANQAVKDRLRELDKRQGYRGPAGNVQSTEEIAAFLLRTRNQWIEMATPIRVIQPDGTIDQPGPLDLEREKKQPTLGNLPSYLKLGQIVDAVVTKVDDDLGLAFVRLGEQQGLIDIDDMKWAHKVDPDKENPPEISRPSEALKFGDLIKVRVVDEKFQGLGVQRRLAERRKKRGKAAGSADPTPPAYGDYLRLALEQEPLVEGALLSLDQKSGEVLAMVGGYDFNRNKFNRAIQAARQTGSLFKVFVYAAALDKGYAPNTPVVDAPIVYEEKITKEGQGSAEEIRTWKPDNHSKKFGGDVLFRTALLQSLNVPTVKITEDIGIEWPADYARRLGVFSPLNMDFSMALGSSSVTLFEMTRAFAQMGRLGRRIRPLMAHKISDRTGQVIATNVLLEERFDKEQKTWETQFEERRQKALEILRAQSADPATPPPSGKDQKTPPLFYDDPDQLMKPQTAFVLSDILHAAIWESGGTGGAARALDRPSAGKTGTTSNYIDAWFIGFTPQIATGVWVGFDEEKTLGQGEVGGRAALPAWLDYMKAAHEKEPEQGFSAPPGVVYVNLDRESGELASGSSRQIVKQAFVEGTEPTREQKTGPSRKDETDFLKEELSQ